MFISDIWHRIQQQYFIRESNEPYCSNLAKYKMLQKGTEETLTGIEQVGM